VSADQTGKHGRSWRRFLEAERTSLENRRRGQLARLLGRALPDESPRELVHLAREDQRRAEEGLVELKRGEEVWYKHIDDLAPEDHLALAEAERAKMAWLMGRFEKLSRVGDRPRPVRRLLAGVARVSSSEEEGATPRPITSETTLLTARELEIISLVARGMSNRQIAYALYVSEASVKRHLANVYPKLGARSRGEAVRQALVRGWLTLEDIFQEKKTS
jgi:ATP/maltotriose-dependent transcriptional regulator MalT